MVKAMIDFLCATMHPYNVAVPVFREVVLRADKVQTIELARSGAREIIAQAEKRLGDEMIFGLKYSLGILVGTELDFILEACESIIDVWEPDEGCEIVLDLPSMIERSTPDISADQIEWISHNLSHRGYMALFMYPRDDRDAGMTTAELVPLADTDRIEGCLLGQGERTGNVDPVTLDLNLFNQGIDLSTDLFDVDTIRRTVECCAQMETSPRAPCVGGLVYTSFPGSHQGVIKRGFTARRVEVDTAGGNEKAVA